MLGILGYFMGLIAIQRSNDAMAMAADRDSELYKAVIDKRKPRFCSTEYTNIADHQGLHVKIQFPLNYLNITVENDKYNIESATKIIVDYLGLTGNVTVLCFTRSFC